MATTTPDGIYYPTSTTQIAPLETQFSTLATSVQTALTARKTMTVANPTALDALSESTYSGYVVNVSSNGTQWFSNGTKWLLANVPVVADATARDALYTGSVTVNQGDTVFRNDLGYATTYFALYNVSTNPGGRTTAGWYRENLPAGTILQVSTATITTTPSTASATFGAISGMSVTLTPRNASSRFLLMATVNNGTTAATGTYNYFAFARATTVIGVGTGAGTQNTGAQIYHANAGNMETTNLHYVDSPATASAVTYNLYWASYGGNTAYINRRGSDTQFKGLSSITVLEIAG
jgi:hypothetical protein